MDTPEFYEPEVTPRRQHTGPAFGLFASATESAFTEEALLYRRLAYVAIALSLWGSASGGLSLALEHSEVDRRALALAGLISGLLLPIVVVLGLRWAFEVVARGHFTGM